MVLHNRARPTNRGPERTSWGRMLALREEERVTDKDPKVPRRQTSGASKTTCLHCEMRPPSTMTPLT